MQKKYLKFIIAIVVLLVATGLTVTFAWFTFWKGTDNVETITDGISFKYDIGTNESNKDVTTIEKNYQVTNLVFFDPDNENEGKYFDSMAICFQIKLHNTSNRKINYTISQSNLPEVLFESTTEAPIAPYALCFFSTEAITNKDTIKDCYTGKNSCTGTLSNALNNEAVIYVYLVGIQPNDAATNEFLDGENIKYNFTINISSSSSNNVENAND